jgi:sulfate adenylyltransferase subunit 2
MSNYSLTHLEELEAEAIYVIREVYAQFDNPAILFSGGKDSIVVAHLARKAFWPAKDPVPVRTHRYRTQFSRDHGFQKPAD